MAYIGSRFAFSLHGIHLWTTVLFHESIDKNMPRPTPQALLLTGILRALWDHQAAADEPKLIVHVYDMPLVRSIKSLPSTHSTVVLILLNELVQLNTDAFTSYSRQTEVRSYSMGFLRPRWACTYLRAMAMQSRVFPLQRWLYHAIKYALQDSTHSLSLSSY